MKLYPIIVSTIIFSMLNRDIEMACMKGKKSNSLALCVGEIFLPFMDSLKGLIMVLFQWKKGAASNGTAVEWLGRCSSK